MTPEQIEASTDASALFEALRSAKDADDKKLVRQIEARMRELAGHNSRHDATAGKSIAADPGAIDRLRNENNWEV